ncbi:IS4 family transposase [Paenibacillus sp. YN15]|uniref:IS4 family transposase n=1 Tax=Paenibacillus sp. YN15 TaxID=1742774 RepID=UPI0015EC3937|nr:IS4 family transposase [Paenibacillus sp. YN15]
MSVQDSSVIRQCFSFLPLEDLELPLFDYRKHKLTADRVLKIFLAAQLFGWSNLRTIEYAIRSDTLIQSACGVTSVSASQLSRTMQQLPVAVTEALFRYVVQSITQRTSSRPLPPGTLALVDATHIHLPFQLADWAYVTRARSGVKIHTRLRVVDEYTAYPDKIVPSTGNTSDYEGSDVLVVDPDVTYVMDRGFVCYKRMQKWVDDGLSFVVRLHNHHHATVIEERECPEGSFILRDATVVLGKNATTTMASPVRLVEFVDEQGRLFRLATTLWEHSATEIANIYRQRWLIELFFKWIKQHLKVATLYSHQPEGVWNHIFLALVAYGVSYLLWLETGKRQSLCNLIRLLRLYSTKTVEAWQQEIQRSPTRSSQGRRKGERPPLQQPKPQEGVIVKPSKKKR